jgi:hypothetical protein
MLGLRSNSSSARGFACVPGLLLISVLLVGCATVTSTQPPSPSPSPSLSMSTTTLNFQNVVVGQSAKQTFTISNTGTAAAQISALAVSNPEFSVTGPSVPLTISPAASLAFTVTFTPTVAGSASATVSLLSPSLSSPESLSLTGDGVSSTPPPTPTQHTVHLTWNASTSQIIGYRVYRSEVSGSSFSPMNGTTITALSYDDATVSNGITYYYVVTAVDASGTESVYSNQVTAVIPAT